jgi:hypothetical protein
MQCSFRQYLICLAIFPSVSHAHFGHSDGTAASLASYYLIMLSVLIVTATASLSRYNSAAPDRSKLENRQSVFDSASVDEVSISEEHKPLTQEAK